MECGQEYTFTTPEQFWAAPDSRLEDLDYALRNYIAFLSKFMDEYLAAPGALDHALLMLLEAPLFTSHRDRMTLNIIESIASPSSSSSTLFVSLMLVLHLGEVIAYPTGAFDRFHPATIRHANEKRKEDSATTTSGGMGVTVGSSKVFRLMRKLWGQVVPVLMKWVKNAGVVEENHEHGITSKENQEPLPTRLVDMPEEGWEERVGVAATAVLYEVCRVQKLSPDELSYFTFPFVSHLFSLVERTRDAEDETFNYTLIKLLIALNEQFMVSALPVLPLGSQAQLPPPILPTNAKKEMKPMRGPNFVLEVLKEKGDTCKTFGENIIFILNRSDGTPDSLCVSLLILKVLYLLFTTSGTQEFFYTNDLCVLVDVFIRELHDLGEESEGLKHTYLRVLHPLMTNTQMRHHPYKRPELRKILETLIRPSLYREVDPTTRRLVERNLRGSWCAGLRALQDRERLKETTGSTLSVDAVAVAEEGDGGHDLVGAGNMGKRTRRPAPVRPEKPSQTVLRRRRSFDDEAATTSIDYVDSPLSHSSIARFNGGDALEEGGGESGLRKEEKQALVDQIARSSIEGSAPPQAVQSSYDSWSATHNLGDSEIAVASPIQADFLDLPSSVPSIEAGHDLLNPVAQRYLTAYNVDVSSPSSSNRTLVPRSMSASHPPLHSSDITPTLPLVAPRPRSTSLSVHSTHSSKHFYPDEDAPPLPSASALPGELALGASNHRRRRPPPPPDSTNLSSANSSRPRTPISASASVGDLSEGHGGELSSPKHSARRRPPPPPSSTGTSSPRTGYRNGFEGLKVA
ncbi:Ldb17p [Sporobolomyces salmoneus]|uniref:Ldb17p n=1 Tax=Sporobolomyces salmoneus TaxID=183962 RepID=UPI0031725E88